MADVEPPVVTVGGWMPEATRVAFMVAAKDKQLLTGDVKVEYSDDGGATWKAGPEIEVTVNRGSKPSACSSSITGLTPLTSYQLRGYQKGSNGWSAPGEIVTAVTIDVPKHRATIKDQDFYNQCRRINMTTYKERFKQIAKEIDETNGVQLLNFATFPGLSEEDISAIEGKLNHKLHPSIREFYKQTDGLQLRWVLMANEDYDANTHKFSDKPLPWRELQDSVHDGCVIIPPLKKVLFTDWEDQVYHDFMEEETFTYMGKSINMLEFYKNLRPMDWYNDYYSFSFYLDGQEDPVILMGNDYHASYSDSYRTDFYSYIEMCIATRGLCTRREGFMRNARGDKTDEIFHMPLEYWGPENSVDLARIVADGRDNFQYGPEN